MKYALTIIGVIAFLGLGVYLFEKGDEKTKTETQNQTSDQNQSEGSKEVKIAGRAFEPAETRLKAGDELMFTNSDSVAHTVTSDTGDFDSGELGSGENFKQLFDRTGTFEYHCSIHPEMKGKVVVEE